MRPLKLLASGCQVYPTNKGCTGWSEKYFIFASTLVVYVHSAKNLQLEKILQDHEMNKSITSICIAPHNDNLLVVCSYDGKISLWDIRDEKIIARLSYRAKIHLTLAWCTNSASSETVLVASCDQSYIKILHWRIDQTESLTEIISIKVKTSDTRLTALRPHSKIDGLICIGCSNGVSILFNTLQKSPQKILAVKDRITEVVDVQFDPLSNDYLLVAYSNFISLWDTTTGNEVQIYETQHNGVTSIAWMTWAPGCFVSSNAKTGTLRVWNVSQKQSLKLIKVAKDGINAVAFGKEHRAGSLLCTFNTGSIVVYNVKNNHEELKTPAAHTETIFDCKINPSSPEYFASCSFDGTVKLWRSCDFGLEKTFFAGDVVYTCEWSQDGRFILGGCSNGRIILWDTESGKEIGHYQHHAKACYCISWNSLDPTLVCSTSGDGRCVVFEINTEIIIEKSRNANSVKAGTYSRSRRTLGTAYAVRVAESEKLETVARLRYSGNVALFGVMWCPTVFNLLVVGSQDGNVRILDCTKPSDPLICILVGHSARSFQCIWSPIVPGMLASGGDDRKVAVWKLDLEHIEMRCHLEAKRNNYPFAERVNPYRELLGHTNNVRALSWNFEHKHVLLSGSWDSTIRIWNVELGTCLRTVMDHVADVYSITSHPTRPFTYLSCSRDSTIRLWELEDIFAALRTCAVMRRSFDRLLGQVGNDHISPSPTAILCGRKSRSVNTTLKSYSLAAGKGDSALSRLEPDPIIMALQFYSIFNFFSGANGSLEIWECVLSLIYAQANRSIDLSDVMLRPVRLRLVLPESEVLKSALSDAKKQESQKRAESRGGEGSLKQEEDLRQAALSYARAGNLTKYCEIMVDLGEWTQALAVAPGISQEYWKALTQRYVATLLEQADETCVPHQLAIGAHHASVDFYLGRKNIKHARITAVSSGGSSAFLLREESVSKMSSPLPIGSSQSGATLVRNVVEAAAMSLVASSNPVMAAAYFVASGFVVEAVKVLEGSGEFDLALALSMCFNLPLENLLVTMADYIVQVHGAEIGLEIGLELLAVLPNKGRVESELFRSRFGPATDLEPSLEHRSVEEDSLKHLEHKFLRIKLHSLNEAPSLDSQPVGDSLDSLTKSIHHY